MPLRNSYDRDRLSTSNDLTDIPVKDGASADQTYTLLLVDPDAPTPDEPKFAWWRHWVLSGLKPGTPAEQTNDALTAYLSPGPKDE